MRVMNAFLFFACCAMSATAVAQSDIRSSQWSHGTSLNGFAGVTTDSSNGGPALDGAMGQQGRQPFATSAAPAQTPAKTGPVKPGPEALNKARAFLKGRWTLESFEVRLPNQPPVLLKGAGILVYDDSANLTMNIRADEKSSDILRAGGVDIRDGAIVTEGRTHIDLQNHTLTYILDGQAPLIKGPLGTDRPRYWAIEDDVLILTTKDQAGQPTSVGRWRKSQ
jgi:hypothetical protein